MLHVACRMSRAACLHACMWRVRRFKVPFDTDTQRRRMCRRLDSPGIAWPSTARAPNRGSWPSGQGFPRARQSPTRPGTPAKNNPLSAAVVHMGHPWPGDPRSTYKPPAWELLLCSAGRFRGWRDDGTSGHPRPLHVACCMSHVACCMLHVVCRCSSVTEAFHVACCMVHVACRTLHVASCKLRVAYSQPVIRSR